MSLAVGPDRIGTAPKVSKRKLRTLTWLSTLALGVCAAVVSLATAAMGKGSMRPLPLFDDWMFLDKKYLIQHLFSPHNEHRIVLTKLAFLADLRLFHGSHQLFFYASTLFLISLAAIYWKLAGVPPGNTRAHQIVSAAIVLELAISPLTVGSLIWAMHLQNTSAPFFAVLAFGILISLWSPKQEADIKHHIRIAAALILAACASFSSGSGVPAPFLLFVLAVIMKLPRRDLWVLLIGGFLIEGLYLHGNSAQGQALSTILNLGSGLPNFFFLFLGSFVPQAFTFSDVMQYPALALCCGIASVAVLVACCWKFSKRYCAGDKNQFALFSLISAAFFLSAAALVTLGRLPFGMNYSYSEHYNLLRALYWANCLICIPACWGTERSWRVTTALALLVGLLMAWHLPARARGLSSRDLSLNVSSAAVMSEVFDPEAWEWNNRWERMDAAHEQFAAAQVAGLRAAKLSVFFAPISDWLGRDTKTVPVLQNSCAGSILVSTREMDRQGPYTKVTGWVRSDEESGKIPELILVNNGRVTGFGAVKVRGAVDEWVGYSRSGDLSQAAFLLKHGYLCRLVGTPGPPPSTQTLDNGQSTNLVVDPSFEKGMAWTFQIPAKSYAGRVANGSIYHNFPAPDGVQAVALQQLASFSQIVQGLKPGADYKLRFYASGRSTEGSAGGDQIIEVSVDGASIAKIAVKSGQVYQEKTIAFRSSSSAISIQFHGLAATDQTAFIDNVSIVKEPAENQTIAHTIGRRG